ncbi:F-box only protein 16-like isoform X3 [Xyrauchen texanus]|uniref:F-box only protein 16-like isoform X3 n=1 Tax=Xyrauchen texanus TaxID=154827 RepID=UPI0022418A35|nr:F-box only protein 16-like isoform X3 [Xyrauchen texanus]
MFIPILTLLQMMPQAPSSKMQTTPSTWTPLNHQLSKAQVFEERRNLIGKWFDKWTDSQRKQALQGFFSRCSVSQLKYLRQTLSNLVPEEALDFTNALPRVLSLYIFSFLDPRSLCRCAQISAKEEFIIPEVKVIGSGSKGSLPITGKFGLSRQHGKSKDGNGLVKSAKGLPPWRDPDRHPTDTISFNYLNNVDPVKQARNVLLKGRCNSNTTRQENGKKYHPTLHTSCASPNL